MRPLAAMYAFMCVQRAGRGKSFVALGASVRTFSCEQTCGDKSFKLIDLFEQVIIMNYSQASNIIISIVKRLLIVIVIVFFLNYISYRCLEMFSNLYLSTNNHYYIYPGIYLMVDNFELQISDNNIILKQLYYI